MAAYLSQGEWRRCSQRGAVRGYFNLGEETLYNVIRDNLADLPRAPAQTVWDEHGVGRV